MTSSVCYVFAHYAFIINHYEPGHRIFLIGFSRGAYTVRSLANLLMLCGVPTKTPTGPLMRFRKQVDDIATEAVTVVLEHGAGYPRDQYAAERLEQARRFREKYGVPALPAFARLEAFTSTGPSFKPLGMEAASSIIHVRALSESLGSVSG